MPLIDTDLVWYPSAIGASIGGAIGGVPITNGIDNNLWPDLSAAELLAGGTRYRKVFVANTGSDPWLKPVIWLSTPPTNMTEHIGLGFDEADDDESTAGTLVAWGAANILEAVSSAADTRTLTVYGVNELGVPTSEAIVLNGTTPVPTTGQWSKVWAVRASATSGSNTVTLKEAAAGTTRGTIPPNFLTCFLWVLATSKALGIAMGDVAGGTNVGVWRRQVWAAASSGVRPNQNRLKGQEA